MANDMVKSGDNVVSLIEKMKPQMMAALPKHMNGDRMARVVMTCIRKNPKLMQCDQASLCGAMVIAAQLGLEPGVNGQCWILPYGTEATFIPGYQGLIDLAYRSGMVDYISGSAVYENDVFDYSMGTDPYIKHKPCLSNRGKLVACYAVGKAKGASDKVFVVLGEEDVEKVKKSSRGASSSHSPWNTWTDQMWIKTAIKRLLKLLPKSVEMSTAIQADDDYEGNTLTVTGEELTESSDPLSSGTHERKRPGRKPKAQPVPEPVAEEDLPMDEAPDGPIVFGVDLSYEQKNWLDGANKFAPTVVESVIGKFGGEVTQENFAEIKKRINLEMGE